MESIERSLDKRTQQHAAQYSLDDDQRRELRVDDGNLDGLLVADIGAYEAAVDEFFASLGA